MHDVSTPKNLLVHSDRSRLVQARQVYNEGRTRRGAQADFVR
jgi:hypothetical protein